MYFGSMEMILKLPPRLEEQDVEDIEVLNVLNNNPWPRSSPKCQESLKWKSRITHKVIVTAAYMIKKPRNCFFYCYKEKVICHILRDLHQFLNYSKNWKTEKKFETQFKKDLLIAYKHKPEICIFLLLIWYFTRYWDVLCHISLLLFSFIFFYFYFFNFFFVQFFSYRSVNMNNGACSIK